MPFEQQINSFALRPSRLSGTITTGIAQMVFSTVVKI